MNLIYIFYGLLFALMPLFYYENKSNLVIIDIIPELFLSDLINYDYSFVTQIMHYYFCQNPYTKIYATIAHLLLPESQPKSWDAETPSLQSSFTLKQADHHSHHQKVAAKYISYKHEPPDSHSDDNDNKCNNNTFDISDQMRGKGASKGNKSSKLYNAENYHEYVESGDNNDYHQEDFSRQVMRLYDDNTLHSSDNPKEEEQDKDDALDKLMQIIQKLEQNVLNQELEIRNDNDNNMMIVNDRRQYIISQIFEIICSNIIFCPNQIDAIMFTLLTSVVTIGEVVSFALSDFIKNIFDTQCTKLRLIYTFDGLRVNGNNGDDEELGYDFYNLCLLIIAVNLCTLVPLMWIFWIPNEEEMAHIALTLREAGRNRLCQDDNEVDNVLLQGPRKHRKEQEMISLYFIGYDYFFPCMKHFLCACCMKLKDRENVDILQRHHTANSDCEDDEELEQVLNLGYVGNERKYDNKYI